MFYKGRPSSLDLGGGEVFLPELVTQEKKVKAGKVTEVSLSLVSQSKDMSNLLNMSLTDMIEAGTPLKAVSPIMLHPSSVPVDVLGVDGESDEKSDDKSGEKSDVKPQDKEMKNEE